MKTLPLLAVLSLLLGAIHADKDDSYYIAGTGNPNVNSAMYWKDAENVLQDLSKFSALYVEFHHCSWTWMQQDDPGNDVDENNYWYLGKIPPMGANVAFSLYGALKGKSFAGCNKNTFINSFYTNQGFDSFARAMNAAGVSGLSAYGSSSSSYSSSSSSSSSSSAYTAECYGGYGVGCDTSNGFALHQYSTDDCDPQYVSGIKDTMTNFNKSMKNSQCIKIYDSSNSKYKRSSYSSYNDNGYYNNNNNDEDADEDGYSSYSSSYSAYPLDLLYTSHACFYQDVFSPDGECPDPYGLLSQYQTRFYQGIQESKSQQPYQVYQRRKDYGEKIEQEKSTMYAGIGFFAAAAIVFFVDEFVRYLRGGKRKQNLVAAGGENDGVFKAGGGRKEPSDGIFQTGPPPAGYDDYDDEMGTPPSSGSAGVSSMDGLDPPAVDDTGLRVSQSHGGYVADHEAMEARVTTQGEVAAYSPPTTDMLSDGIAPISDWEILASRSHGSEAGDADSEAPPTVASPTQDLLDAYNAAIAAGAVPPAGAPAPQQQGSYSFTAPSPTQELLKAFSTSDIPGQAPTTHAIRPSLTYVEDGRSMNKTAGNDDSVDEIAELYSKLSTTTETSAGADQQPMETVASIENQGTAEKVAQDQATEDVTEEASGLDTKLSSPIEQTGSGEQQPLEAPGSVAADFQVATEDVADEQEMEPVAGASPQLESNLSSTIEHMVSGDQADEEQEKQEIADPPSNTIEQTGSSEQPLPAAAGKTEDVMVEETKIGSEDGTTEDVAADNTTVDDKKEAEEGTEDEPTSQDEEESDVAGLVEVAQLAELYSRVSNTIANDECIKATTYAEHDADTEAVNSEEEEDDDDEIAMLYSKMSSAIEPSDSVEPGQSVEEVGANLSVEETVSTDHVEATRSGADDTVAAAADDNDGPGSPNAASAILEDLAASEIPLPPSEEDDLVIVGSDVQDDNAEGVNGDQPKAEDEASS